MTTTKTTPKKAAVKTVAKKVVKKVKTAPVKHKGATHHTMKHMKEAPIVEERNLVFHPIVSEKAVNAIDKENTLQFAVLPEANKIQLKSFLEKTYNIKVAGIRTLRDGNGQKKAIVRLVKEQNARDIATKMGVL